MPLKLTIRSKLQVSTEVETEVICKMSYLKQAIFVPFLQIPPKLLFF